MIELVIILAIAALVLALLTSVLQSLFGRAQDSAVLTEISTSLMYARSEAIKRGGMVSVCPSRDGETCIDGRAPDWQHGWLLFQDFNRNGRLETGDTILRVHHFANPQHLLHGHQGIMARISYKSSGFPDDSGWLEYCDPDTGRGHRMQLSTTGRLKVQAQACRSR